MYAFTELAVTLIFPPAIHPFQQDHIVVTLFLTMLVGAGGNAGNQSAIKVIRGLVSVCGWW